MLLGSTKLKYSWQILAVSITFVENCMKNLFTTKSSAREYDTVNGHTSKPYNSTGKYLLLITCRVISSEAVLPILTKAAFAAR